MSRLKDSPITRCFKKAVWSLKRTCWKRDYALRADLCDGVDFPISLKNHHSNPLICPMVEIAKGFSGPLSCGSEISIQKTVFVRLIHLTSSIALLSVFVETISRSSLIEIFWRHWKKWMKLETCRKWRSIESSPPYHGEMAEWSKAVDSKSRCINLTCKIIIKVL